MTNLAQQYSITQEPFYQAQTNEVALYEAAYKARLPVMVKGPTGCGKSRFIEYMAWKLGKPLITVACNEDMTASDLVGRYLLEANGTRWLDGPLTHAMHLFWLCQWRDQLTSYRWHRSPGFRLECKCLGRSAKSGWVGSRPVPGHHFKRQRWLYYQYFCAGKCAI